MKTTVIKINRDDIPADAFGESSEIIRGGGLVAFPTETVYGLGGNALDADASRKIYAAKGRPSDNPLIAHIAELSQLYEIAQVNELALNLAHAFWPGPMTMVLPKKDIVPMTTTGGLDTVAVRMPSHPVAQAFLKAAGVPVAAPSANISGRPSPTKAEHVIEDMDGKIEMIIDGGDSDVGLESTIIDVTGEVPTLLRPGGITPEMIREITGELQYDPAILGPVADGVKPKAPGMKYRHYAPKAELTIVKGDPVKVQYKINKLAVKDAVDGKVIGVIASEESKGAYPGCVVKVIGRRGDEEAVAHNLFDILRRFDDEKVDVIYSECFDDAGLGMAIMNRLKKAAGYKIIEV